MGRRHLVVALVLLLATIASAKETKTQRQAGEDLWTFANEKAAIHRFSTLFTAQNVRDQLATDAGLDEAVVWCKGTGVTKVYIEVFRSGYQADKETLVRARDRFRREGFVVCGGSPRQVSANARAAMEMSHVIRKRPPLSNWSISFATPPVCSML